MAIPVRVHHCWTMFAHNDSETLINIITVLIICLLEYDYYIITTTSKKGERVIVVESATVLYKESTRM